jgi:hypothetical protein
MSDDVLMHPQETADRARALPAKGPFDREGAEIPLRTVREWHAWQHRYPAAEGRRARYCPRCDGVPLDEPAYAYLLGLYLGDGHLTRRQEGGYALSIACANAWPGLIEAARRRRGWSCRCPPCSPASAPG